MIVASDTAENFKCGNAEKDYVDNFNYVRGCNKNPESFLRPH